MSIVHAMVTWEGSCTVGHPPDTDTPLDADTKLASCGQAHKTRFWHPDSRGIMSDPLHDLDTVQKGDSRDVLLHAMSRAPSHASCAGARKRTQRDLLQTFTVLLLVALDARTAVLFSSSFTTSVLFLSLLSSVLVPWRRRRRRRQIQQEAHTQSIPAADE